MCKTRNSSLSLIQYTLHFSKKRKTLNLFRGLMIIRFLCDFSMIWMFLKNFSYFVKVKLEKLYENRQPFTGFHVFVKLDIILNLLIGDRIHHFLSHFGAFWNNFKIFFWSFTTGRGQLRTADILVY